jgi:hypothetical protein
MNFKLTATALVFLFMALLEPTGFSKPKHPLFGNIGPPILVDSIEISEHSRDWLDCITANFNGDSRTESVENQSGRLFWNVKNGTENFLVVAPSRFSVSFYVMKSKIIFNSTTSIHPGVKDSFTVKSKLRDPIFQTAYIDEWTLHFKFREAIPVLVSIE